MITDEAHADLQAVLDGFDFDNAPREIFDEAIEALKPVFTKHGLDINLYGFKTSGSTAYIVRRIVFDKDMNLVDLSKGNT